MQNRVSKSDKESRIVPYSKNFTFGFKIQGFLNSNKKRISLDQFIEEIDLGIEKNDIDYLIKEILYVITNSKKLLDFEIKDKNKEYVIADLGKICFKFRNNKYYPLIAAGMGPEYLDSFYDSGDRTIILLGINPNSLPDTELLPNHMITLKYTTDQNYDYKKIINNFREDANKKREKLEKPTLNEEEFKKLLSNIYPYNDILNFGSAEFTIDFNKFFDSDSDYGEDDKQQFFDDQINIIKEKLS